MKFLSFLGIILINLSIYSSREISTVRYMETPSVKGTVTRILPVAIDFKDTISGDTLYLQFTSEGLPQSAFRKINTGVCVDNQCRLLDISVYWDITGRYLGFELPPGEFLSKTEHQPFSGEEYKQLHTLLADPYSPLANYTLEELVPQKKEGQENVDAISSATVRDVLNSVVEGAVYTTYTLWHVVYGNSQKEVRKLGLQYFSDDLVLNMLDSPSTEDRIWVLDHLSGKAEWSNHIRQKVLSLISNDNFYLSGRAIQSFTPEMMASVDLQKQLYTIFGNMDYSVKRLIVLKLSKAPVLSEEVRNGLASGLSQYWGSLSQNILDLFIQHQVDDVPSCLQISELLSGKNRFLARKAFNYLDQLSINNRVIKKRLKKYASN